MSVYFVNETQSRYVFFIPNDYLGKSSAEIKTVKRISKIEDEIVRVSSSGLLCHASNNDQVQDFISFIQQNCVLFSV